MIIKTPIGQTFGDELRAANLLDDVMWTPVGVEISETIDADRLVKIKTVIAAHDPTKSVPPVVVLPVVELYRAMTDDEFIRMQAGVAAQSPRIQGIFARAVNFRSDAPEWPLLQRMAETLYGKERAAELLTPPA